MVEWLKNITDKERLQDNLTFVSLYIAVYENMVDYVVTNLKYFLCDFGIKDGKEFLRETEVYRKQVKNRIVDDRNNKDTTKASFLWLVDRNAISQQDYQCFLDSKNLRNTYAHEMARIIYQGVQDSDVKQFLMMFLLYRKISKWYFLNIEAVILGDELPSEADLDTVVTGSDLLFGTVLEVLYNGKSGEYKDLIDQIEQQTLTHNRTK